MRSPVLSKTSAGMPGFSSSCPACFRLLCDSAIIGNAGLLVFDEVGRDPVHLALDLRRGLLAERRQAKRGRLPDADLVDVLRSDARLDHQGVGGRHDLHDRLAGRDDPADRVHRQLVHAPRLRRADVDLLQR